MRPDRKRGPGESPDPTKIGLDTDTAEDNRQVGHVIDIPGWDQLVPWLRAVTR